MNYFLTKIENYLGFDIMKVNGDDVYMIDGSVLRLTSIEVAKKIIDLHIKNKNDESIRNRLG